MKHLNLKAIAASALLLACGFGVSKAQEYFGDEYRQGEVIIKFKDLDAISVKATTKGLFSTTSVSNVDAVFNAIGATKVEPLMPLTGNSLAPGNKIKTLSGRSLNDTKLNKLYLVKFDTLKVESVETAIEQLKSLQEVEYVEPNYIVRISAYGTESCSKEPLYSTQYALNNINMPQLWDMPLKETRRPVIAIIDTGVDITHPDIAANIWTNETEANGSEFADDDNNGYYDDLHGWDFVYNTAIIVDGMDRNGHGTHCAGIAAAVGNNGIGVTGANPDALIMPIKVMGDDGSGDIATVIKGIDYARAAGADVLSMSLGHLGVSQAEKEALLKASYNSIIVAAAGNNGASIYDIVAGGLIFPAAYDFVVGVQASGINNRLTQFSNFDPDGPFFSKYEEFYNYEVLAPGSKIMSLFPGGKYKELSGTSMATPLVAGAVSRALQVKGYDAIKEYGFIGDIAMSRLTDCDVIDASKLPLWDETTRQVALRIMTCELVDTIDGDGDGQMDVGETIEIYPTVRSLWGRGENVKLEIVVATDNISENAYEIISNNAELGYSLTSRGIGKSKNPIIIKIKENVNDGYNIPLTLNVTCDNSTEEQTHTSVTTSYPVTNAIEIGGMVTKDLTLYPNKHYIVTQSIAVPDGVKLTIKPGTVLKFKAGTGMSFANNAILDCVGTPDSMITFTMADGETEPMTGIVGTVSSNATICYANFILKGSGNNINMYSALLGGLNLEHCVISSEHSGANTLYYCNLHNCNIIKNKYMNSLSHKNISNCNYVENISRSTPYGSSLGSLSYDDSSNNTFSNYIGKGNNLLPVNLWAYYSSVKLLTSKEPNYFGTAVESTARTGIADAYWKYEQIGNAMYDLSNMRTRPNPECHGIVWKVVVNGYDAQDEFEQLPPLGVGTHKFEVYFNRKMKESAVPNISMGLQEPYTQTTIAENGSWSEYTYQENDTTDVTVSVYTAYLTIDAKNPIDGLNRISVEGAQDLENFEIPIENKRFNVMVQSAGSLSSGFMAEAGLGKVNLTWENPEENFDDMLGYNMYRYTVDTLGVASDTIRINTRLLDPEEVALTDYDVVPGTTYYYYYKVLRTNMAENSPSLTVAATPLTASKGDANGSMSIDVADVVTEIAYLTNQNPQPFIFEAADVNSDESVNILDVVGTLNIIITPADASAMTADNAATYSIEDGILYIESPVALGGVQLLLNTTADKFEAMDALSGFELVTSRQDENSCLVLAYSMSGRSIATGRQAILKIGDAAIEEIILSDTRGKNVLAANADISGVGSIEAMQMSLPYPNPFNVELSIPYIIGQSGDNNVKIMITDLAGRTVNIHETVQDLGEYVYTWTPGESVADGVYFVSLYVNDTLMQTAKVVKE